MLEDMYEIVYESKILYRIEVCGLNETRKELVKFHRRFFKKSNCTPNFVASGFSAMQRGRV
jgi:hypothetical protein